MFFNRYHNRARRNLQCEPDDFPTEVGDISWVDSSNPDAFSFSACVLETGEDAYIAKTDIGYQKVSGFTTRQSSVAYIPYGCIEHTVQNYQVLSIKDPLRFQWLQCRNGNVPKRAVIGGIDGGTLQYIGRTCTPLVNGRTYLRATLTLSRFTRAGGCRPGKVFPPHRCLYVPYNGRDLQYI